MIRFILFPFLFLFFPVSAWGSCPIIAPNITITLDLKPVKYDHSLDRAQIRVKSNASGLVSGHLQGNVNVKVVPKTQKTADGKCIFFRTAEVLITNTPILRIASNFPKGSCEYNVVKIHEEKHVKVMTDFLNAVPQDYQSYLEKAFTGKVSASMENKHALKQDILKVAQDFVNIINRDQSRIHQRDVDHPDKVADERKQCHNW